MATRQERIDAIDRLLTVHEGRVAEGFRSAINDIRSLATLEAIENALRLGPEAVVNLFSQQSLRNAQGRLSAAIGAAAFAGARQFADGQPPVRNFEGDMIEFVFNVANPRVAEFAERVAATRVREVSNDVRDVIRTVTRQETAAGVNPREAAIRIRSAIGLTRRQEQAVQNFRQMLSSVDRRNLEAFERNLRDGTLDDYLGYSLRDRRFDRSLIRAVRQGEPLSADQINQMVNRYRERFVRYRSEVIGRTESLRAMNGASHEYIQQQVAEGRVDERQIRRFWVYTKDARTRAAHRSIPSMNEGGVRLNEPFQTPLGPLMYPGDPGGRAENVIQCRCTVFDRVVSAELVGREGAA